MAKILCCVCYKYMLRLIKVIQVIKIRINYFDLQHYATQDTFVKGKNVACID